MPEAKSLENLRWWTTLLANTMEGSPPKGLRLWDLSRVTGELRKEQPWR